MPEPKNPASLLICSVALCLLTVTLFSCTADNGSKARPSKDDSAEYQKLLDELKNPHINTTPLSRTNPLAGCILCHVDIEDEHLASTHCTADNMGCVECHGQSVGHINDENNEVKPDVMFTRANTDRLCSPCHDCSRQVTPDWKQTPASKRKTCTGCHPAHRFPALAGAKIKPDLFTSPNPASAN